MPDGPRAQSPYTRKNASPAALIGNGGCKLGRLFADAEFLDNGLVALGIVFLEIVQQATTLADQHEKTAPRSMVFLVRFEVLRQLANPFAKQRYLYFWAPGVGCMRAILVNEGLLLLSG